MKKKLKPVNLTQFFKIFNKSYDLWGNDEHHRRQWIRKTVALYSQGRHASQTGGWKIV